MIAIPLPLSRTAVCGGERSAAALCGGGGGGQAAHPLRARVSRVLVLLEAPDQTLQEGGQPHSNYVQYRLETVDFTSNFHRLKERLSRDFRPLVFFISKTIKGTSY